MEQIKDILKDVIADLGSEKRKTQEEILKIWQDAVGKKGIKHTKIIGIKDGRLLVNVDSSVWLFQLSIKRNSLLEKLRRVTDNLKEIRFRIGQVK